MTRYFSEQSNTAFSVRYGECIYFFKRKNQKNKFISICEIHNSKLQILSIVC